jgi:hypothetical protein
MESGGRASSGSSGFLNRLEPGLFPSAAFALRKVPGALETLAAKLGIEWKDLASNDAKQSSITGLDLFNADIVGNFLNMVGLHTK